MADRTLPEQVILADAASFWDRPLVSIPIRGDYLDVTPKKLAIVGGVGVLAFLLLRGRRG